MIKYHTILPPQELAPYVRFYWAMESSGISGSGQPYIYRSMADGCAEIIFHYKGLWKELSHGFEENCFVSGLHGPSSCFRRFMAWENFGIFGVYLYPFAIPALFSLPVTESSNQMPDMKMIMGKGGEELEEKIMLCNSIQRRAAVCSTFFLKQLKNNYLTPDKFCLSVKDIINKKGDVNIKQMAYDYNLSLRQFQRKFKLYAGFSPKLYARIIRFGAAMNQYGKDFHSLTDLAYECGYYDQSHFIHEFKQFSGHHPHRFFSGLAEGTDWRGS